MANPHIYERDELAAKELLLVPGGPRTKGLVEVVKPGSKVNVNRENIIRSLPRDEFMEDADLTLKEAKVVRFIENWVAFSKFYVPNGDQLLKFVTRWTVPPEPILHGDQTIYLFNGLQSSGSQYTILQPVLQWEEDKDTGKQFWAIASWCVTSDGLAKRTPFIPVTPGDVLTGIITFQGKENENFLYRIEFEHEPDTAMVVQSEKEFVWVVEALEVYNIRDCKNYPGNHKTLFFDIEVTTARGKVLSWEFTDNTNDCGVGCLLEMPNIAFFYQKAQE